MRVWPWYIVGILTICLTACLPNPPAPPAAPPKKTFIKIFSPTAGEKFILGSDVQIQSTSVDPAGIQRVELLINNQIIRTDTNPEPLPNAPFVVSQAWRPRTPSRYTIQVRAYNASKLISESEPLPVEIVADVSAKPPQLATPLPIVTANSVAQDTIFTPTPPMTATELIVTATATITTVNSVAETLPSGTELVIDNNSPGFQTSGRWYAGDGGHSYEGNCAWAPRGPANNAYWTPTMPQAGTYEVWAWWCGDPNHDQSTEARFYIHSVSGKQLVRVNLQEQAGQWNSLGRYFFEAGTAGLVNLNGGYSGNVVADAVKFVYLAPENVPPVIPTPLPTDFPWTNQPPSPLQQIASADLAIRLAISGDRFFLFTPIVNSPKVVFNDCQDFPHEGCNDSVMGWRVQVEYANLSRDIQVTYRVREDYQWRAIEPTEVLQHRQRIFLQGQQGDISFEVDRYPAPDYSWHLFGTKNGQPFEAPLSNQMVEMLNPFMQQYNSVAFNADNQQDWVKVYGFGERLVFAPEDITRLSALVQQLVTMVP